MGNTQEKGEGTGLPIRENLICQRMRSLTEVQETYSPTPYPPPFPLLWMGLRVCGGGGGKNRDILVLLASTLTFKYF